jgi:hypothetical protein
MRTLQVYFEAIIVVPWMVTIGIISGFIAAVATGDRAITFVAGGVMAVLTAAILLVRLWRLSRMPVASEPDTPPL